MARSSIIMLMFACCSIPLSALHAELDAARVFPASLDAFLHVTDVQAVKERMAEGAFAAAFGKVSKAPDWQDVMKRFQVEDKYLFAATGLYLDEVFAVPQGELAIGLFEQEGTKGWCLLVEPKSELVAVEILRSGVEKRFQQRGYTRTESRVGDCFLSSWFEGDRCVIAYTIREEKLLVSSSPKMLEEMANRWVLGGKGGLDSDPEFSVTHRNVSSPEKAGISLFFRNQNIKLSLRRNGERIDLKAELNGGVLSALPDALWRLDAYGVIPLIQSDVTSTYMTLLFPEKTKGVEMELKVQLNTPKGDEFLMQPGRAVFPEQGPFAGFDVINYAVLNADFWTASEMIRDRSMLPSARRGKEENRELARKFGLKDPSSSNNDKQHFLPLAYQCRLADGSWAFVFKFRDAEKSRDAYSKGRFSELEKLGSAGAQLGKIVSTQTRKTSEGVFHVETISVPFVMPASIKAEVPKAVRVYGIRGDYYIVSNSERFFTDIPLFPDETLSESTPFKMVKRKLEEHRGNTFAIDYWDLPRQIERSGKQFGDSRFIVNARRLGFKSFDDLFRAFAEDFGPVGGAVSKNTSGFRLDYFLLTRN